MHREAADCEAVHPRTHPVDVDEENECAGLVQARISGDAPKIGRNADGRCGARVKSGQGRGVQRYEIVVSDQTSEHVGCVGDIRLIRRERLLCILSCQLTNEDNNVFGVGIFEQRRHQLDLDISSL